MSFLQNPFAWALAGLLPIIVVFYLLKLKRRRMVIPSTLLWRRSVEDLIANSPFQKLRNNLLMWLQLLLLALLIMAFMRPVTELDDLGGSTIVLLIDTSASMQAVEATGNTRIGQARAAAREVIDNMGNRDEAIIVTFSNRANIVQTLTSDKVALRNAIADIQATDTRTDITEAANIIEGITTTERFDGGRTPRLDTRTILISDGALRNTDSLVDIPNLSFVQVGDTDDNVGITTVDVRESFSGEFTFEIFAALANASDIEREVFVELQFGGQTVDIRDAVIPANGTSGVVFRVAEALDGVATLRIDESDAFALDNIAYVQLRPPTEMNVLVVSNRTSRDFLENALLVDPRVRVSMMRPVDYPPREEYDLTIFDGATTAEILPGNYVFINSVPPLPDYAGATEPISNPRIIDWNRVHPLMRFLANFDQLRIGEGLNLQTPDDAVAIAQTLETDLISLLETDTHRVLTIGFDFYRSTWPVDVAFPIFWTNAIDYFARMGTGGFRAAYPTGSSIPIVAGRDSNSAVVATPSGREVRFDFDSGIRTGYLTDTAEAGIYTVRFDDGGTFRVPVNLASPEESDITPRAEIEVAGQTIEGTGSPTRSNREIWHWLALAALGFLMLEWTIYCRRTFA